MVYPKKDPRNKASQAIPFRFTLEERRLFDAVAEAENKTKVGLLREMVKQRAKQIGIINREQSHVEKPQDIKMNRRDEIIERIARGSNKLNDIADKATTELTEVEDRLVKCGVGTEVWIEGIRADDDSYKFGFSKVDGQWGLAVKSDCGTVCGKVLGFSDPRLIRSATRDERTIVVKHIDSLLQAIDESLSEILNSIQRTE